ncbi:MAG: thioredoxin domain-containing protein [Hyphomicrobiales bacterium]|nr:thioredoxin domain-containing protein [Hyphomicrobiales bacterium]
MPMNRLASETSPYLLQHRDNPVHWWAWGPEALAEAKRSGKPILLSVGYAACHWCHVMAHESFEDDDTAAVMNELYVNIKVDREERPDIDAIYMAALHRLGEHGGWPLTMFLDSDARPFWGGTYFPKTSRYGKPAFVNVLRQVERVYREDRAAVDHNTNLILSNLAAEQPKAGRPILSDAFLADFVGRLVNAVDPVHGGLKGAPKFPQWSIFQLLWRGGIRFDDADARRAVETTLVNICQGGIYDHIGGGFARYSVDDRWLVPHFEKMLYDNALLIDLMTEVWRETRNPLFQERIAETVEWLSREMIAEGGGFAASLDADSEGEEGKFYVWSRAEVLDVLGPDDGSWFCEIYDINTEGNFEGHSIANRLGRMDRLDDADEAKLATMRRRLLDRRAGRIRPGWDDKVLADWNGLMIAALARAAVVFKQPDWLAMAERAFGFVRDHMHGADGRLRHTSRAGRATVTAMAADYANMIHAALRLHQATGEASYLATAQTWLTMLDKHHLQPDGGYATTADDTTDVIVRLAPAHDDAVPNPHGTMLMNLVALYLLTGDNRHIDAAEKLTEACGAALSANLVGHCGLAGGMMDLASPTLIAVIGDPHDRDHLLSALHRVSLPGAVEISADPTAQFPSTSPLHGKSAVDGKPALYACVGPSCSLPVTDDTTAITLLRESRLAPGVSRRSTY